MTNAQKWVLLFFALFIVFLIVTYFSNKEEETYSNKYNQEAPAESGESGLSIYQSAGCASCHGENLQGTQSGPALVKLSENWTKRELVSFLRNPDDFSKNERITKYKEKFGNSFMPSFNSIDAQKLGKLAEYLLSK